MSSPPLHPQSQAFLAAMASQPPLSWEKMGPLQARATFASLDQLFGVGPAEVAVEDRLVDESLRLRFYRPPWAKAVEGALPVILYFHGGGWVLGSIETHDALCCRLCMAAQCRVVAVDYRLSPENVFPAAVDDGYRAAQALVQHASAWGIDRQRLIVAGDSAGGNLAAQVALRARDRGGPAIMAQVLIYPALDPSCDSESYHTFAEGFGLGREDMRWFWRQYLGPSGDAARWQPTAIDSLAGSPTTVVLTAQYDVLRDEAEAYARRLQVAGVKVYQRRYDGMLHGFLHFVGPLPLGETATSELGELLQQLCRGESLGEKVAGQSGKAAGQRA